MAALRRTLVDDQAGNRYIASVPGRGCSFAATRSRVEEALAVAAPAAGAVEEPAHNLAVPVPPTRTVGRAKTVTSLVSYLALWRSITRMGQRDVGKTTVALATAEALRAVRCRRCGESLRC